MNDDLTPDPELERRLDALRDNLTSRPPRPDARIAGLLGAGPTTAEAGDPPRPEPDVDVTTVTPITDRRRGRERLGVGAAVAATLVLLAGAGALALNGGSAGSQTQLVGVAATIDGAEDPDSGAGFANADEGGDPDKGGNPGNPDEGGNPGNPDEGGDPDGHPSLEDLDPPVREELRHHLEGHREWLLCVTGEVQGFLEQNFAQPLSIEECGDLPSLGDFPDIAGFDWFDADDWLKCDEDPEATDDTAWCVWDGVRGFHLEGLDDVCDRLDDDTGFSAKCAWPPCDDDSCDINPCPNDGADADDSCLRFDLELELHLDLDGWKFDPPLDGDGWPWKHWFDEKDEDTSA